MANSIPLSTLHPSGKIKRNGKNQYLVRPPGDEKRVGYTRVTNVAKVLDDNWGLAPWQATMTLTGAMMRPGLWAQWEALMAETGGNPWYHDDESKAACKRLVEECSTVGGANDRREIGTARHKLAAMIAQGHEPEYLSEQTRADLDAYVAELVAAGITIVPHMVEVMVVLDAFRVAGMFDLLTIVPSFSRPLVTDLKTGASLDQSWQTISVQMAAYSRGVRYVQGEAEDGSEDERPPMPEVDQENGLVVWLPAGSAQAELHVVDLTAGWEAFERSMWTRSWRNRVVARPLADGAWRAPSVGDRLIPDLEASLAATNPPDEPPAPPLVADYQEEPSYNARLRAWLQERIDIIGGHAEARGQLARVWPEGTPPLTRSADHTPEQLDAIEVACNVIEREFKFPFPEMKPEAGADPVGRLLHLFPNATVITTEDETS